VTHITVSTFESSLLVLVVNIIFCTKKREAKVSNFQHFILPYFLYENIFYKLPQKIGNSGSGKSKMTVYPEMRDFAMFHAAIVIPSQIVPMVIRASASSGVRDTISNSSVSSGVGGTSERFFINAP
jgi:hypothetical protein